MSFSWEGLIWQEDLRGNFSRKRRDKPGNACGLSAGKVLNSLLFILATGCRQCDLPRGASKSSSRRRLKAWHLDGALNELKTMILGIYGKRRIICWNYEDTDGSFSNLERRRQRGLNTDAREKAFFSSDF
ncbi:MAG: hypothetical protein ACTFAL_14745 [Candidatus Electronema sp. V4]|uniref:hypothetical protein n=1 Tax=Candidatus Electronema sp. V4 TaxID=3454756 RepID=UPI0040559180